MRQNVRISELGMKILENPILARMLADAIAENPEQLESGIRITDRETVYVISYSANDNGDKKIHQW